MVNYYVYKTTIFFISLYKSIEMLWIRLFPNFYEGMLCDVLKSGGIDINGDKPWDIQVFFSSIVTLLRKDSHKILLDVTGQK